MTQAKKTVPIEEAVVVDSTPSGIRPPRGVSIGSIFWGFAFIGFGVLLLLDNLNIITVHFGNIVQLWPVAVIGVGISMLSLRGWLAGIISLLLVAALGALVVLVAVDNPWFDQNGQIDCSLYDAPACIENLFKQ